MELSVIIVNYNGLKYLKGCFDSLYENLKGITFEIIVVDNNSADESCNYIRKYYPGIRLIESPKNLGFGKGNNVGAKEAMGKYLLLINNDTIILDKIEPVLTIMKNDKQIGALTINMLDGNKNYLKAAGNFPTVFNLLMIKSMFWLGAEFRKGHFKQQQYQVDWISGAFMLIPKKIYDEVGGFDERYFMYVEDVDLCKKIADRGYKRIFMPAFSYIHFVGFSTAKNMFLIRGLELYVSKFFKGTKKTAAKIAIKINTAIKQIKG